MAELHKPYILALVDAGLARFVDGAKVTIKKAPPSGADVEVPFKAVEFVISTAEQAAQAFAIAETGRGTVKGDDGTEVPGENPINTLLAYAYGLNCRAKVRATYEAQFEDPEKAIKKIAELLVKQGRFKSIDKAMAAARLLQETDE